MIADRPPGLRPPALPSPALGGVWRSRPLTPGERLIARVTFGEALPLDPIRLVKAAALPSRFAVATPFSCVLFCAGAELPEDFSAASLGHRAWLVHELTHLWQAARGIVLPLAKLRALGRRAYRWSLVPPRAFLAYNIEQQAEMTAVAYLFAHGYRHHDEAHALCPAFAADAREGRAPSLFDTAGLAPFLLA